MKYKPTESHHRHLGVQLNARLDDALTAYAERHDLTRSQVARLALRVLLAQEGGAL